MAATLLGGPRARAGMLSAAAMLAIVGGLVAAGLALSFYGSSIIADGLEQGAGSVGGAAGGAPVSVSAELGGEEGGGGQRGVFVVQVMDPDAGAGVTARVSGPAGEELAFERVREDSHEGYFDVGGAGAYTLRVDGDGAGATEVLAVIGAVPGTEKFAVGFTGFYLTVAGLIGMGAVGVIAVRARSRRRRERADGGGAAGGP